MTLALYDAQGTHIVNLADDFATLSSSGIQSGMRIHVTDQSQPAGIFDDSDAADLERFRLSKEEYRQKEKTVHNFLRQNRLGKFSEEYHKKLEEEKQQTAEKAAAMKVGDRCQVSVPLNPVRRGTVAYIGKSGTTTDS